MSAPTAAMIFAAGRGTRMGALTRSRPKSLLEVGGKPLLDHALQIVQAAGLRQVVINTHYLADQIVAHVAEQLVEISHEETLLETGGGLRKALPMLGAGPVVTLNADAVWNGPNPVSEVTTAWNDQTDALLLLVPRKNAVGHTGPGDFFLEDDSVLRRRGCADHAPFVYTGLQIIRTERLMEIDRDVFSLNLLWDLMLPQGRVRGCVYQGRWADVGLPENLALAEAMYAR